MLSHKTAQYIVGCVRSKTCHLFMDSEIICHLYHVQPICIINDERSACLPPSQPVRSLWPQLISVLFYSRSIWDTTVYFEKESRPVEIQINKLTRTQRQAKSYGLITIIINFVLQVNRHDWCRILSQYRVKSSLSMSRISLIGS